MHQKPLAVSFFSKAISGALVSVFILCEFAFAEQTVYLFSYFSDSPSSDGNDGLHLAYSLDGLSYHALNGNAAVTGPMVGSTTRDPYLYYGSDGVFRLVHTTKPWNVQSQITYGQSTDLLNWTNKKYLNVAGTISGAQQAWAPEIAYDSSSGKYMIYWSTATSSNPAKAIYYCTTTDFSAISSASVLYNYNGNTTIDADIVYDGTKYVMFAKDETSKNIYSTTSTSLYGPYSNTTSTVTPTSAQQQEGPSAIKIGSNWIVYTDHFSNSTYGAQISTDNMSTWSDYTMSVSFPSHTRHGDVLAVPLSVVTNLIDNASNHTEEIEFMGAAGTSDFQTAANWIGGSVPGAGQTPVIEGGYTINMNSSPSGTLTGLKTGQTGTGTLNISNATISISSTWPNGLLVGQRAGANGAVVQSGASSSVSVAGSSGFVSIGQYGTGSYTLQGGTLSATGDFNVGDCCGSHGYFYMQGGALNIATLYVGNGYYSSMTDSGITGNALGYFNQTGGTVSVTGTVIIGGRNNAYGIGSYQISAGSLIQSSSSITLYVGQYGAGTLTVSGSGLVDSSGGITLGGASSVTGEVFLNGGTIYTTLVADGGGTSKFHFNGGTLKAKSSTTTFMHNLDTVDVQSGGAIIDTNGFNDTITQQLLSGSSSGGLTKNGSGILTLSANPTYTGQTVINTGQLMLNTGAATTLTAVSGAGGLIVGNGSTGTQLTASSINVATLTIAAGSTVTISPIAGGPTGDLSSIRAVPEPSSALALLGIGVSSGLIAYAMRRGKRLCKDHHEL